uniref:Uncharacterized protein n=1 Tax=Pseudomonas aeruginosa TaxID=287 RepID=A0A7S6C7F2_PSEAI|nr:hypothetical protein [Pseudomonas aeruginosa]
MQRNLLIILPTLVKERLESGPRNQPGPAPFHSTISPELDED